MRIIRQFLVSYNIYKIQKFFVLSDPNCGLKDLIVSSLLQLGALILINIIKLIVLSAPKHYWQPSLHPKQTVDVLYLLILKNIYRMMVWDPIIILKFTLVFSNIFCSSAGFSERLLAQIDYLQSLIKISRPRKSSNSLCFSIRKSIYFCLKQFGRNRLQQRNVNKTY